MIKAALVLIYNSQGELALQLRAAGDDSYPLHWDFSAGGGVDTGEDALAAAQREVREELGVEVAIKQVDQFTYADVRAFNSEYVYPEAVESDEAVVFSGVYDGEFLPDPKEVQEIPFFTMSSLRSMIVNGGKFHPELGYFLATRLLNDIPQFGDPLVDAKDRPGAYAVVKNDAGQILVVVAKGRYHLPGGGIDEGEDPQEAVKREILEETGYSVEGLREFGRANQFLATKDLGPINKIGVYYIGDVLGASESNQNATDHESKWISSEEFLSSTAHEFHKWAVKKAFEL